VPCRYGLAEFRQRALRGDDWRNERCADATEKNPNPQSGCRRGDPVRAAAPGLAFKVSMFDAAQSSLTLASNV
jgi:hypothetical protein